jgi:hypothetical protein
MMSQQITTGHLYRLACLYARQSILQQVFENTESTARQYALRDSAGPPNTAPCSDISRCIFSGR